ncbi:MAG: aminoacyl-tRNA hydrolase, partial [Rikenellaceae bacterium]
MKYLIVGLGNIGNEYAQTRHNIGFKVLDALARASNISFTTDRLGDVATLKHKGRTLVLLKPSTYMNLSGKAVKYWMDREKIPLENLLIVVDDLALPFCKIRIRKSGSDAGHNGLKDINAILGTQAYNRIRMGIGNDYAKGHQVDYVIGEWSDDEKEVLPERLEKASEAIKSYTTIG